MTGTRAAAVLFDMDGVLIDSEPVWYAVEAALVTRLGGSWTAADQAACMGGTLFATATYIAHHTGTDLPVASLVDGIIGEMAEHFATGLPVVAGALELVDAVASAGVPTALVTSTYRRLLDAALPGLGAHRFDVTVAGDEVVAGKPAPEPYLAACRRLGVDPADCVVVEDAPTGVAAALAAGCTVYAVPSSPFEAPIAADPRVTVVTAVRDIDPAALLRLPGSGTLSP